MSEVCGNAHGGALPEVGERGMKPRMTCHHWQKTISVQMQATGKSSKALFGSLLFHVRFHHDTTFYQSCWAVMQKPEAVGTNLSTKCKESFTVHTKQGVWLCHLNNI